MSAAPPIGSLQAFEAVARRRSFALAASELHRTASAVSHQIARLESHLGVRLLERSAHAVRLSAAGEQYLNRIAGALVAITAASDDLRQGASSLLYVRATPGIATLWLLPRLRAFAEAYPDIALNLSASHTFSDFALDQADIDIRYGRPDWRDVTIEPVFEEPIVPMASPQFIRDNGLKRPDQLTGVPLIQSTVNVVQWSDWFAAYTHTHAPEKFAYRFDRAHISMHAAAQGLGVTLQSAILAAHYLETGALRAVFGRNMAIKVKAHFAVYPPRNANRQPVTVFLAWLRSEADRSASDASHFRSTARSEKSN